MMARPLALAAGQRPGQPVQVVGEAQDAGGVLHLLLDDLLVHPLEGESEGDVVKHRHLGVEGVALEHHGHLPLPGAQLVGPLAVDEELPVGDVLQPGDHPQRGGFPAAGRPDKNDELPLVNLQVEVVHRMKAVGVDLIDVFQG